MTEAQVLDFFASSALGQFTRDTPWAFPLFEIAHFFGLCLLFGSLMIVDLRVLGLGKTVRVSAVLPFVPLAIAGLLTNLISGIAFFCSDPANYWFSPTFRWKLALVIFGGLNALAFEVLARRKLRALDIDADADLVSRAIAALSLATWLVVIVLGRLLPYVGGSAG